MDIGLSASKPTEKTIGDGLFQAFIDVAAEMGVEEVIWNRRIWSTRNPHIHAYHGHSPHTDHVHVGFTRAASQRTSFPNSLQVKIGQLRTGLEDLSKAFSNVG